MTDFEWLDSGPNGSEGHYSMHSKNPHFATPLYTTRALLIALSVRKTLALCKSPHAWSLDL